MKKSFSTILLATSFCSLFLMSCGKSKKQEAPVQLVQNVPSHTWYYFADGNFKQVEKPSLAPESIFKPWTEAVRISAASCQSSSTTEDASSVPSTPKGFAIVNRAGVLVFEDTSVNLFRDIEFFTRNTAGNLVFYNNTPVFSVFKNTFFNENLSKKTAMHPFLVQFNTEQNVCYPIINIENLGLSQTSEITDFIWDGQYWTCSVKDSGDEKIQFSYLTFQPKEPLTQIYPTTASQSVFVRETSMDSFRNIRKPELFNRAPKRVKDLLSSIPEKLDYAATVYTASGHTPRNFIHGTNSTDDPALKVSVILNESWAAALFNDGTLFLNGALYDKYVLDSGKNIGVKLPKLPDGFVYSDFTITGTTLYAGWEETSFYQTARSGFLSVDLNQLLYKKL